MASKLSDSEPHECIHCGRRFSTVVNLRCHTNRTKRCYEMNKALHTEHTKKQKLDGQQKITDDVPTDMPSEPINMDDAIPSEVTSVEFNSAFELFKTFTECGGGKGLSMNDISKILKLFSHPEFKIEDILKCYHNGPSGMVWYKQKLESMNGPLQVLQNFHFKTFFCLFNSIVIDINLEILFEIRC